MAIKHFDSNFFNEIISGMSAACKGIEVQQLLGAATQIYLASSNAMETVKQGTWKEELAEPKEYKCRKVVECPFCGTRRGVFMGDTIDYCGGCGSKMEINR
jgi:hypothetical protein